MQQQFMHLIYKHHFSGLYLLHKAREATLTASFNIVAFQLQSLILPSVTELAGLSSFEEMMVYGWDGEEVPRQRQEGSPSHSHVMVFP